MRRGIRYTIEVADRGAHLYRVKVEVASPDEAGQAFRLPTWIPGSYLVRDFAGHVVSAEAACDGSPIGLTKTDKSTWIADACRGRLVATFEIYAWEMSVRGAHVDGSHAYFNGPCVFPAVVGQEQAPCELDIAPPADGVGTDWRVATALQPKTAARFGYGTYSAADYWELIDHPVEIADQVIGEFDVNGIPHTLAVRGHDRIDIQRLCDDAQTLCRQHHELLGAPDSLDRYVFLLTVVNKGYGGIEHRWSSSNLCSRDDLPARGDSRVSTGYRKLLGLLSHEYFHLWNVTRMKPAAFTPYDLSKESYTGLLWVFEGITSYYDDLALARSGLITRESYLDLLAQTITRVLRTPGRHRQTVEDSSFDAWCRFYKPHAGSLNFEVSYYTKGSLAALALDITIRRLSNDTHSLDDVMRECWRRYGDSEAGMPERGLESVAREVCDIDLGNFFEQYIRGMGDLPLEQLLHDVGIRYNLRAAISGSDTGGKPAPDDVRSSPWLGCRLARVDGVDVLATVFAGSAAERAGLAAGDELLALDGIKVDAATLRSRLADYVAGDTVTVSVFRRDDLLQLPVRLDPAPADTCWLTIDKDVEAKIEARRDAWLGGPA